MFWMVSIPVWCDWKTQATELVRPWFYVSIPVWCDWKVVEQFKVLPYFDLFQFQCGAIGRTR